MTNSHDLNLIRELAKRYAEIAAKPIQDQRRDLWRRHNSLHRTRPLIYMRWLSAWHEHPMAKLECQDRFFQPHERFLKQMIVQDSIGDDYIIEPWITQQATTVIPETGHWGVQFNRIPSTQPGGAWKSDPPLKQIEDIAKMVQPHHVIDEKDTALNVERLQDAVGDTIEVNVDRGPYYRVWTADLSTDLGYLRGIEQFMWDMTDNPQWLHQLLALMSNGVLGVQNEAEQAGDYSLCNHQNQAMSYAEELPDPKPNSGPVSRDKLWVFCAAQEFALVSPAMHDEFMFQYQMPILENYGLVAYGCCEDMTNKIDMVRKLPNLRRIGVTPVADVARSAEQIQDDYVFSWRPNPAEVMCCGFDPDHIRKVIRDAMERTRGCHVDITLKDVETIENEPERLAAWVRIVRDITDEY